MRGISPEAVDQTFRIDQIRYAPKATIQVPSPTNTPKPMEEMPSIFSMKDIGSWVHLRTAPESIPATVPAQRHRQPGQKSTPIHTHPQSPEHGQVARSTPHGLRLAGKVPRN